MAKQKQALGRPIGLPLVRACVAAGAHAECCVRLRQVEGILQIEYRRVTPWIAGAER